MSVKISLPWPPNDLSPNSRTHWATKTQSKKAQREAGYYFAYPFRAQFVGVTSRLPLRLVFYPPDARKYDLDGLLSRCKQSLDGVALCLGVNDVQFRPITIDMGEPDRKNSRVEVEIG